MVMIGPKNRRVSIQRQTTGGDSLGDIVRTPWTTLADVWASIEPLRGQDKLIAMQVVAAVTHKVRIRYAAALRPLLDASTEFRIALPIASSPVSYRYLRVNSAVDVLEQHREIEIMATECIDG